MIDLFIKLKALFYVVFPDVFFGVFLGSWINLTLLFLAAKDKKKEHINALIMGVPCGFTFWFAAYNTPYFDNFSILFAIGGALIGSVIIPLLKNKENLNRVIQGVLKLLRL